MRLLSQLDPGRDNNLNLLRCVAASAVLVSHSVAIVSGRPETEPLRQTLGMTPGTMAVDAFFVASGFLVTRSLQSSRSALDFAWARALRIYPGLWVMLLLVVGLYGPWASTLPLQAYFASAETWSYLLKCATLWADVSFALPGVLEHNPLAGVVNGSLWTMPHEVRLYAFLLLGWLAARAVAPGQFRTLLALAVLGSGACVAYFIHDRASVPPRFWLFFMFSLGAAATQFRHRLALGHRPAGAMAAALVLAAGVSQSAFMAVYAGTFWYLVLYLAYVPGGAVRAFNRVGDYSYGIYVYAFPVQQACVAALGLTSALSLTLVSGAITLLLAVCSWHAIEKPALAGRHAAVRLSRSLLGLGR